jgi:EmrB/QacA subfamily drug resistance transporter
LDSSVTSGDVQVLPAARRRWVLVAACTAIFMSAVEATIIATAMPTIVAALGGFDEFSWAFGAYLLAQAVTTPIYGRLADLYGRRMVLTAAILLFLLGTALCSMASSMLVLIGFRALQGLGAGALVPISMTIVGDLYPPRQRAKIQGYLNAIWGGAAIVGPLLGAFLVATLGWPSVFWINVPIGFAALAVLWAAFRDRSRGEAHRLDLVGTALLVVGTGSLMLALVDWAQLDLPAILALLAVAAVSLTGLVFYERRVAEPMLPLEVWRHPVVSASNMAALAIGAVMMGVVIFVPIYVQGLMGRSALVAGFALTSESIAWMFTGAAAGWLLARWSYRSVAALGGFVLLAGGVVLATLDPTSGPLYAAAGAFLVGGGMGFCNTTFLVAAQSSVPWHQRGAATASNVFMRTVGQACGAAVLGGIVNASLAGKIAAPATAIDRLMEATASHAAASGELAHLAETIAQALGHVFLATILFAICAIVLAFRLPAGTGAHEDG